MEIGLKKDLAALRTEKAVEEFIKAYCIEETGLHNALNEIMTEKNISLSRLMKNSQINRNYGYNIINGKRKKPARDKVIALCIAAKLTLEETQEMLALSKVGELYYKRERDVRLAYAINKEMEDVLKVNIMLSNLGLEPLDV